MSLESLENRALLAPFHIEMSIGQYPYDGVHEVGEGASFQVYLTRGSESHQSQVSWSVQGDGGPWGATHGDDFSVTDENLDPAGASGTETVEENACGAVLNINITDDDDPEFDEYFTISITGATPDGIEAPTVVRIKIAGDLSFNQSDSTALTNCNCSCDCGGKTAASDGNPLGGFTVSTGLTPQAPMQTRPTAAVAPKLSWTASDNPHPIIAEDVSFGSSVTSADLIEAKLYYGGLAPVSVYYDASTAVASTDYRFAVQADASSLPSGQHSWVLDIIEHHTDPDDNEYQRFVGSSYLVNRIDSEFGNRWALEGVDQLFIQAEGALLTHGNGHVLWFPLTSGSFGMADGDTSGQMLTTISGGNYQLTDKWGNYQQFNSSGQVTYRVTREGQVTSFSYTSGKLTGITDGFGRSLTLAYTSGKLSSTTDYQGNVTTLGRDGSGRLTTITQPDPDGAGPLTAPVTTFTYDSGTSLLTSLTNPDDQTTSFAYGVDRSLASTTFEDTNTRVYDPYLTAGMVDPAGSNGTTLNPADLLLTSNVWGRITDENNHTTYYRTDRFGQYTAVMDAAGNTTTYVRDSLGQVTERIDPDPDGAGPESAASTTYTYSGTNLTQISYPDGSYETWTYNTTLNKPTEHVDRRGSVTKYTLNSTTGLVTSVRQVIGQVDGVFNSETDDLVTSFTYTPGGSGQPPVGLVATVTDPTGAVTVYGYNTAGDVTSITYADGTADEAAVTFTYTSGLLTTSADELGNETDYAYDDLNRLTSRTLPDPDDAGPLSSPVWEYEYNNWNQISKVIDPLGHVTLNTYNSRGDLVSERRVVGNLDDGINLETDDVVTSYGYDDARNLTTITDPLGRVTTYAYDVLNRRTSVTLPDPDGAGGVTSSVWATTYDAWGRITSETDPLSISTLYAHSLVYRTLQVTLPDSDGAGPDTAYTVGTVFDANGNVTVQHTPLTDGVTNAYDALGRVTSVTGADPDGGGSLTAPVTYYNYHQGTNLLAYITDPLGNITANYSYDGRARVTTLVLADPDGMGGVASPYIEYTYNDANWLTSMTDELGRVTTYTYDNLGRKLTETLPDPDGGGSLTSPVTSWTYDALGNVLTVTDPLGQVTTYGYDSLYNLTSVTQPDPDAGGSLTSPVTTYTFDAAGQMLTLTDPVGNVTTWTYDNMGRVLTETNELSDTRSFVYDKNSNLVQKTDRNGRVTDYVYDKRNRLIEEKWMNGMSVVRTIAFAYDGDSRLTSASDPSADYDYAYDNLGRVLTETQDFAGLTPNVVYTSAYNAARLRTSLATEIGGTDDFLNEYAYDGLLRQTQVKQSGQSGGNAVDTKRVDFGYNAAGQFDLISRFANLAGSQAVAETAFNYDGIGRISSIEHLISSTQVAGYDYTWDVGSRITSIDNFVDGVTDYGYDQTNQLTSADNPSPSSDEAYSFDENGNRTMSGYTVGANNRVSTNGTFNFTYDDEGNLLTKTNISTAYKEEYAWDYRNRLTGVTFKDNLNNVLKTVEHSYDYFNRWIRRTVDNDGPGGAAAVDTFFSYEGNSINQLLEFDGSAASDLSHRYLWGPVVDQILADEVVSSLSSAGNTLWGLADHLGSIRDIADRNESSGAVTIVNHLIFDGFGVVTYESNGSFSIIFGFTGKSYDDSTGFQNNWQRWYAAYLGEWMSEDPIGLQAGDPNFGRYAFNDSVRMNDPSGLAPPFVWYWYYRLREPQPEAVLRVRVAVYDPTSKLRNVDGCDNPNDLLMKTWINKKVIDIAFPLLPNETWRQAMQRLHSTLNSDGKTVDELWLIGHGSHFNQGTHFRFNGRITLEPEDFSEVTKLLGDGSTLKLYGCNLGRPQHKEYRQQILKIVGVTLITAKDYTNYRWKNDGTTAPPAGDFDLYPGPDKKREPRFWLTESFEKRSQ